MQIVLTRPLHQSTVFSWQVQETLGPDAAISICPLLDIVFLPLDVELSTFDGLVFTSQNGVLAYVRAGGPSDKVAFCVGAKTARIAADYGLDAKSADGDLDALNTLVERDGSGLHLAHLSGKKTAGTVRGNVTRLISYDQQRVSPPNRELQDMLAANIPLLVPLFSPFSAECFSEYLGSDAGGEVTAVCMSENVAACLDPARLSSLHVCPQPTGDAMLAEIRRLYTGRTA